ncbi:unnamed protein product [Discula destructiva]
MFSKLKTFTDADKGKEGQADKSSHEESLTTVLPTREDRAELILLIANLMESMQNQITSTFDPTNIETATPRKLATSAGSAAAPPDDDQQSTVDTSPNNQFDEPHSTDAGPPDRPVSDAAEPQNADSETEGSVALARAAQKSQNKAQKALENRVKDLAKVENIELRTAALHHFNQWRDKVLQRIGEAVNQKDPSQGADAQKCPSRPASRDTPPPPEKCTQNPLLQIFTPCETPLASLSDARKILILHSILLLLLGLQAYPAESRVLMLRLASSLRLSMELLGQDEMSTAEGLLEVAKQHMNADEETTKKAAENQSSRKWKVGLGAVAGAVLIGVTGGLAAPLLAAGVGSMMGGLGLGASAAAGYLGALAGSAPLVGVLFGAYGGRMTGKVIDEYAKHVEDFAFMPMVKQSLLQRGKRGGKTTRHLRVAIGISGWLTEKAEVGVPWQVLSGRSTEAFALRWEVEALLKLGHALSTYIKSYAWGFAKKEILSRTIFASLASALVLPYGLAKAARLIDNPFSVAVARSEKAGVVLADALINKVQGERPVTLIGYSLGARVIYSCLSELANRKAFGLVESVCLMGAPVPSDPLTWRRIRSVVAGRVVNVYSTEDYLLAFLYRANSLQYGIAGLQAIPDVPHIENVDVSAMVDGHTQYRFLVGAILQKLDLEDIDADAVEQQMKKLKRQEDEDNEARAMSEAKMKPAEEEADEMQEELERKNEAMQATKGSDNEVLDQSKSLPADV